MRSGGARDRSGAVEGVSSGEADLVVSWILEFEGVGSESALRVESLSHHCL